MTVQRLEFDCSLDDVADVQLRLALRTETFRRQRRNAVRTVAICSGATPILVFLYRWESGAVLVFGVVFGVVFGALAGFLYGRYHDGYIVKHTRRVVEEMLNGASTLRCEYELRPAGLWTKFREIEMTLPWSRLTRIEEVPGAIELWFSPSGLAVVRERAFQTAEDRRRFLDAVRAHLPAIH